MIPLALALAAHALTACTPKGTDDPANPADADTGADADSDADSDTDTDSDTDNDPGFVKIRASTFDMGSTAGQPDEGYGVFTVTLTHDYFVAATEVTQRQFVAVMGSNGAGSTDCDGLGGEDCPVAGVNWSDSAAYANAVSDGAGLSECYACTESGTSGECDVGPSPYECDGYRLLTEAEWEGAARCGTDTKYSGSDSATGVAWTSDNSAGKTHPVGGLDPNACGIYDMSGNVWEWTQDWSAEYPADAATDPTGPSSGSVRAGRGGSWRQGADSATVSHRDRDLPGQTGDHIGFRLARTIP